MSSSDKVKEIIFVSESMDKFKEMENFISLLNVFSKNPIQLKFHKPVDKINEIQSLDRKDIVKYKLKDAVYEVLKNGYYDMTSKIEYWIMVEDTSFTIDTEGGFPGPFIKFYLESMSLENISTRNINSNAQSIVSIGICKFTPMTDIIPYVFEGIVGGQICSPRGNNGFGYDAIFTPTGSELTNAEMTMEQKMEYNPRINCLSQIITFLS